MILQSPVPDADIPEAAALYWQAFAAKLHIALGPADKGQAFVTRVFDPTHGISIHADDGTLLGVAGFKTAKSALVGGEFADLKAIYGLWGATWRAALLHMLERDTENSRFLMDGVFVAERARGQGVGTALLRAICAEGARRGYAEVRLDVIDSNPRAQALYAREGFVATKTTALGPLRHIFGFNASTTMVKTL
ncbi:GNAT family N-acetyltransferase [Yoonia sp. R2331]|uniref:GNAT family N-acetyltransferase n=1 Tax=Yoonia sp. R2331 TaxID=3237238 RepID=UPI0034E58D7A